MKIQQIETAVRKQLPGKKEASTFLSSSEYLQGTSEYSAALIIFCGLCRVYVTDGKKKAANHYDLTEREFTHYANLFQKHIERVAVILKSYGVNVAAPDAYKQFSRGFWQQHNAVGSGEVEKSGIILCHILSSKKEYMKFLRKEDSCFVEKDFTSFYIFNKARLAKNFLTIGQKSKEFVELLDLGY